MNQLPSSIPYVKIAVIAFLAIVACADSIEDRITRARNGGATRALVRIANDIDALNGAAPVDYFKYHEQLEAALEMLANTNTAAMSELEKQLQLRLRKQCQYTNPEIIRLCLNSKTASARRLVHVARSRISPEFIGSMAAFLGEIRTMIVLDYKPLDVSDNVVPPLTGSGPINAGMDPKAIADPRARAAYEKALTDNRMSHSQNELQLEILPRLNREVTGMFTKICKSATNITFSSGDIDRLAKTARLSKEERRVLFKAQ